MERSSFRKSLLDKSLTRRAILIGAGQLVFVGFLIRQMRELQLQETEKYQLLAEENRIDIRILPPVRGIIFDETGETVAKNQENYDGNWFALVSDFNVKECINLLQGKFQREKSSSSLNNESTTLLKVASVALATISLFFIAEGLSLIHI